jgi:tetratricopeptide (TPR) repeat protein
MKFSIEQRRALCATALIAVIVAGTACLNSDKKIREGKRSDSHIALARKLIEQRRLHEALTQVNMAIDEWEKNPDGHFLRGQIHFGLGMYDIAIADFSRAMDLHEDFTEALSWKAWAEAESGDSVAAERDWTKALANPIYPSPEKIHLNLGMLLISKGRREDGISHLRRAVAQSPGYARGHFELGKVLEEDGDLKQAAAAFQAALGGMKDSPEVNLRLALVLEKQGSGALAKEHFKRVIELSPEGPEAELARDHLRRLDSAT